MTISNTETNTAQRFDNLYAFQNYDPIFMDFYTEDDTDQDLWTKKIGETEFLDNKFDIRKDLKWTLRSESIKRYLQSHFSTLLRDNFDLC